MSDPSSRPRLADLVRVERVGRSFKLEIDGQPFEYAIDGDTPIETQMEREGMASLRFTLLANRVELVDQPPVAGGDDD
jgi:hypothetical protein